MKIKQFDRSLSKVLRHCHPLNLSSSAPSHESSNGNIQDYFSVCPPIRGQHCRWSANQRQVLLAPDPVRWKHLNISCCQPYQVSQWSLCEARCSPALVSRDILGISELRTFNTADFIRWNQSRYKVFYKEKSAVLKVVQRSPDNPCQIRDLLSTVPPWTSVWFWWPHQ